MSNDIVLVRLQNGRELVRQLIEEGNERIVLRCMNNKYSDTVIRKNDIKDIGRVCIIQAKAQII
jgi:phage repressor protein C with HTH and peptisase S24 domain